MHLQPPHQLCNPCGQHFFSCECVCASVQQLVHGQLNDQPHTQAPPLKSSPNPSLFFGGGTRLLSAIFEQIFCCFQANTCRNNILSMVIYPLCVQSIWYERSITFIDLIFRTSAQGFGTACHLLYLKLHWKCSLLLELPFPYLGSLVPLSPCFCSSEFQCRVIQNCRSCQ